LGHIETRDSFVIFCGIVDVDVVMLGYLIVTRNLRQGLPHLFPRVKNLFDLLGFCRAEPLINRHILNCILAGSPLLEITPE